MCTVHVLVHYEGGVGFITEFFGGGRGFVVVVGEDLGGCNDGEDNGKGVLVSVLCVLCLEGMGNVSYIYVIYVCFLILNFKGAI